MLRESDGIQTWYRPEPGLYSLSMWFTTQIHAALMLLLHAQALGHTASNSLVTFTSLVRDDTFLRITMLHQ